MSSVKLISYSRSVDQVVEGEKEDLLNLVSYCARVSNPSNQTNTETSEKLIRYLAKHAHWSPFELVNVCLEITTTRDITHQIVRHRSFAFQEFSQRYADPTKELNFVTRETRLQDTKNRQNSIDLKEGHKDENGFDLDITWQQHQENIADYAKAVYEYAIRNGIAKEQARVVLPEGLTESRLYMNGTLRSWIHYIDLRSGNGTQKEHQEVARQCAEAIRPIFGMIMEHVSLDP